MNSSALAVHASGGVVNPSSRVVRAPGPVLLASAQRVHATGAACRASGGVVNAPALQVSAAGTMVMLIVRAVRSPGGPLNASARLVDASGRAVRPSSLVPYFTALSPAERDGIEAIVMDRWEPYRTTVRLLVTDADAKIVFDKFHVPLHVQQAVDTVRKQEHKALTARGARRPATGDRRLTRTKYHWLTHPDHFTATAWAAFIALRTSDLKAARAWAMKESIRRLWDYTYLGAARTFFRQWYGWASRSQLAPMIKVAKMLKAHLENILTYLTHRVTNAMTEGLNANIQWIKYPSRGYRDRDAFKMAILFHCGGLALEPRLGSPVPIKCLKTPVVFHGPQWGHGLAFRLIPWGPV